MINLTGQMGVPVIAIDEEVVVGFDRPRLDEILSSKSSTAAPPQPLRFGLRIADASKAPEGGAVQAGAYIGGVTPGLLGEKAGLKEGDIITGVNSTRINSADDMQKALSGLRSGNIVSLIFWRGNEQRKSEIVV